MQQLGDRCHPAASASQINKLEKGQIRLTWDWLQRIADALEVHPSDLKPELGLVATTDDEIALLEAYRGLSEADQARFRAVAEALQNSQNVEGKKS